MGVRGLSSFFDMNPDLSKPHQLHNTRVVIDGNNLVNVLYYSYKVDCTYGGDYYRFACAIKKYFTTYLQCQIVPIVIFDGGYDKSDRKLHTTITRARTRLGLAKYIAKHGSSCRVLPVLALNVLKDILKEMNIMYAQCDFEADDQITAIANYYQCPVISEDSDFYIFDIFGGFVRMGSVGTIVHKFTNDEGEEYNFLSCTIYHIDNFLSFFPGIEKIVLPLFSTLIGNDFIHSNTFDTFFANIKLPKIKSKKLRVSKRHQRMIGLLGWLKSHTLNSGIELVLQHLKKDKRNSIRELINKTVDGYNIPVTELVNYLDGVPSNYVESENCLLTWQGNSLPKWFTRRFHKGKLSPFLLNSVGLRRVFLMSQVEDVTLPSTHKCSLPIRKVLYGLLLTLDDVSEHNASSNCVEEYDRESGALNKSPVVPTLVVDGFGKLPKLTEVKFDTECNKFLILCVLGEPSTCLQDIPKVLQLLVLCIRYWLKNAAPRSTLSFIDALLLTILYLNIVEPIVPDNTKVLHTNCEEYEKIASDSCEKLSVLDLIPQVSVSNATFFSKNMTKYFQKPVHNHGKNIVLSIIHGFNQLQSCIYSVLLLNDLLGNPFMNPKPHGILSGSMIYNLTRELQSRPVPELYISETLGRGSVLDYLFQKLKHKVLENLQRNIFSEESFVPRQKKKKRKEKKVQGQESLDNSASAVLVEDNCFPDISNKFGCLTLTDNESDTIDVFL